MDYKTNSTIALAWERDAHLDASTASHALYSQVALVRLPLGAAQRLIFQQGKLDLTRRHGEALLVPETGESGR